MVDPNRKKNLQRPPPESDDYEEPRRMGGKGPRYPEPTIFRDPSRKQKREGWTIDELTNLIRGVVLHRTSDSWDTITDAVGRSRTACRAKWFQIKKKGEISLKIDWTPTMDYNLRKLREIKYDWKMIAQILDVPDYMECKYHWTRLMQKQREATSDSDSDERVRRRPTKMKQPSSGDDGDLTSDE
jgi:hypothetical protein